MSKEIESLVMKADIAVTNVIQVADLKSSMAAFGYDDAKMKTGRGLVDIAKQAVEQQKKEYGEQYEATDNVEKLKNTANSLYIVHLKIARIVFDENNAARTALQLNGKRKQSLSGYLSQAETFYANLLANGQWLTAMSQYNMGKEKLEAGKKAIADVAAAYAQQKKETGEAQEATQKRDAAIDELNDWYGTFIKIARLAVSDNPQLMEMLGKVA